MGEGPRDQALGTGPPRWRRASAQALVVELGVVLGVELGVGVELLESDEVDDDESDEPLEDSELDGVELLAAEAVVLVELPPRLSFL